MRASASLRSPRGAVAAHLGTAPYLRKWLVLGVLIGE